MLNNPIGIGQPQGGSVVLTPQQQKARLADALMAAGAEQGKTAQTPMGSLGSLAQTGVGTWMNSQTPQTTLGPWQTSIQPTQPMQKTLGPWQTSVEGPGGWQTSVQPPQPPQPSTGPWQTSTQDTPQPASGGFWSFLGL